MTTKRQRQLTYAHQLARMSNAELADEGIRHAMNALATAVEEIGDAAKALNAARTMLERPKVRRGMARKKR